MQRQPVDTRIRLSRILWFGLIVAVLGGLCEQQAAAQAVSFAARSDYAAGNFSIAVTVGDFNRDGKLDLAVANLTGDSVWVLLGSGTGSFGARTDFVVALSPGSLAVGDFNGDSKLDLAVTSGVGVISILLGNGDGTFGAKTDFDAGASPGSVAVGDFNSDGKPDLVVSNTNDDTFSLLVGNGSGGFETRTAFETGGGPARLPTRPATLVRARTH